MLPGNISKKQWDKSLGSLKHAAVGLIIASAVCILCETVYFFMHLDSLRMTASLQAEAVFFVLQLVLLVSAILYGIFYDKNFSG